MQDSPEPAAPDADRISLSGYPAITDWCRSLGCSEVELAEAIGVVGYSASLVRAYLEKRRGQGRRSARSS
jgi:uncharacterized protein DUF3606